jgi:hypothetical protein
MNAGYGWRKIMSKTHDTSRDELTIEQLDAVSGGFASVEHGDDTLDIRRSMPNGRTDVIKAMGNTKWRDI